MYQSTPQHIIDEEMAPGPVAAWIETGSSESSSSSSSSDSSSHAPNNATRMIKRVMVTGRFLRKPSNRLSENGAEHGAVNPSETSNDVATEYVSRVTDAPNVSRFCPTAVQSIDNAQSREDAGQDEYASALKDSIGQAKEVRGNEEDSIQIEKTGKDTSGTEGCNHGRNSYKVTIAQITTDKTINSGESEIHHAHPRSPLNEVGGALKTHKEVGNPLQITAGATAATKQTFIIRSIASLRSRLSAAISNTGSIREIRAIDPPDNPQSVTSIVYGVRRTNSLPARLDNTTITTSGRYPRAVQLTGRAMSRIVTDESKKHMSKTSAVLLLLISTGLVAFCADFLVESIEDVANNGTGISKMLIGLIILPLIGNAAEHITAVAVAAKNKMDLAIGVAIGSSIQIGEF